ncbi:MAG: Tol-Pal system protein TolB, partial [Pseudomonadota bacterium]|nr:Tol-Pal system protein TolB [Pseudomonadota bacterium]
MLQRTLAWIFSLSSTGLLICGLFVIPALSQTLRLDITEGQIAPIPVAVADFTGLDGVPSDVGRQISRVIS